MYKLSRRGQRKPQKEKKETLKKDSLRRRFKSGVRKKGLTKKA